MTKIGYARVSSVGQSLDLQTEKLEKAGCDRIYQEKVSGTSIRRPQLKACLDYIREGDCLVITRLDRLARSMRDLVNMIDRFNTENIQLLVLDQSLDTGSPSGKLLFNMLAVIAEFENDLRRERQLEGIAKAKSLDVKFGRPKKLAASAERALYNDKLGGLPMRELAKKYNVGEATVYRIMAHYSAGDMLSQKSIETEEI